MIEGLTKAKSPVREHRRDKDCYAEPSSMRRGETVDLHNALFMQASLFGITAFTMHSEATAHTGC